MVWATAAEHPTFILGGFVLHVSIVCPFGLQKVRSILIHSVQPEQAAYQKLSEMGQEVLLPTIKDDVKGDVDVPSGDCALRFVITSATPVPWST